MLIFCNWKRSNTLEINYEVYLLLPIIFVSKKHLSPLNLKRSSKTLNQSKIFNIFKFKQNAAAKSARAVQFPLTPRLQNQ